MTPIQNPYRKKIRLIEHGIPPPAHALTRKDILAKFCIPDDAPLLLMAARLDLQKGQHIIVSALQELPRVRLVMAVSGPEKQNLLNQAGTRVSKTGCISLDTSSVKISWIFTVRRH